MKNVKIKAHCALAAELTGSSMRSAARNATPILAFFVSPNPKILPGIVWRVIEQSRSRYTSQGEFSRPVVGACVAALIRRVPVRVRREEAVLETGKQRW
jgi:hypothetical protein